MVDNRKAELGDEELDRVSGGDDLKRVPWTYRVIDPAGAAIREARNGGSSSRGTLPCNHIFESLNPTVTGTDGETWIRVSAHDGYPSGYVCVAQVTQIN